MMTGDSILCLAPMEYDKFVAQAINVVRHAQGTEKLKERQQLLRSTNQTIGKQLVALESMLERAQYAIRKRNEIVNQLKSDAYTQTKIFVRFAIHVLQIRV